MTETTRSEAQMKHAAAPATIPTGEAEKTDVIAALPADKAGAESAEDSSGDNAVDPSVQSAEAARNEIICALMRRLVGSESENLPLPELLDRLLSDIYRLRLSLAGQSETPPSDVFGCHCAASLSSQFENPVTAKALQPAKTLDELTKSLLNWLASQGDKRRSLPELLDLIHLNVYQAALNKHGHSHRKTADSLGMNRNMLSYRLNRAKRQIEGNTIEPAETLDEITQYFMNCFMDNGEKKNSLPVLLDRLLLNIYRATLDECGHSHREAAKTLGMDRNTLYRQIKRAECRPLDL